MNDAVENQLLQALGLGPFEKLFEASSLPPYRNSCRKGVEHLMSHGQFESWWSLLLSHPHSASEVDFNRPAPWAKVETRAEDETFLRAFGPWKKGPFQLGSLFLDAEWRSDLKWARVMNLNLDWTGRSVLDVGTGNGYFLFRALGSGATSVLGLEPSPHYVAQFLALRHFFPGSSLGMIPVTAEQFPLNCRAFDLVSSMGVLYHRRNPLEHIEQLMSFVRPGGKLLLETIVVQGPPGWSLCPPGRYANMRNVWFLPTLETLLLWMRRLGLTELFHDEPIATTPEEQRSTPWSGPVSLRDALHPKDPSRTLEDHPAPQRVIVTATVR